MSWNDRLTAAPQNLSGLMQTVTSGFFVAEVGLMLLVLVLAALLPRSGARLYERIEAGAQSFLEPSWRPVVVVGLLAFAARAVLLPWQGTPAPTIHDEHSLLLQAQTYLAGRLANPTHPFWEHFESFHVNQIPAYASMYFPGRGAPLALGLLLADNAWIGVWLSFILMCMAAVWMLQAWVPAPYAFLGGVLLVLRFGVFSYWVNSYWGGAFAALGAMLVVGALPRIEKRPGWRMGATIGVGAAILMTTRSFEGLLLCLAAAAVLLVRLARPTWQGGQWLLVKVALPAALAVGAGGAALLAYNAATTGDVLLSPYALNRAAYAEAPAFLISPPVTSGTRGPSYFRDFYRAESKEYVQSRRSLASFVKSVLSKLFHTWNFYVGPVFTAAFVAGLWVLRRHRFVMGAMVVFFAGYSLVTWHFAHYVAPILPVLLIVLLRGFEWLRTWEWRGRPSGLFLTRAMPTAALAVLLLPFSAVVLGVPQIKPNLSSQACCAIPADDLRSRVIARLQATPGRDLVLVRDGPHNPLHYEMVYNPPDIDSAPIVFAHRLDPARDEALLKHFAGRSVWEFEWRPELPEKSTLRPLGTAPLRLQP